MNTTINRTDGKAEIRIEGRVDTLAAPALEQSLAPLMKESGTEIVMDCSAMEYISSSGLRVLLTLQKAVSKNGSTLVLMSLNDDIREIFDMTGFSKIFTIK